MRNFFAERSSLRLFRVYVSVMTAAVLVSWPSNPVSYYIQFSSKPITLPLSFMVMFFFTFFLSLMPEFSDHRGKHTITDWLHYTPVSVITVFSGYFLYSMVHVAFLLALVAPLLIAAAAASGLAADAVASSCLIVFVYSLFFKQLLHMLTLLFETRPFVRTLIFGAILVFSILLSVRLLPVANPVLAAQSVIANIERTGGLDELFVAAWQDTVILYAVGIAAVSLVSILRLGIVRRVTAVDSV